MLLIFDLTFKCVQTSSVIWAKPTSQAHAQTTASFCLSNIALVYFVITSYVDLISSQRSSTSQSDGATLYDDILGLLTVLHCEKSPSSFSSILYTEIVCFLWTISRSFRRFFLSKSLHRALKDLTAFWTGDSSSASLDSSSYHTSSSSSPFESLCELMRRRCERRTASARRYGSLRRPWRISSSAPLYTSSWWRSFFSPTACDFVFSSLITASCGFFIEVILG